MAAGKNSRGENEMLTCPSCGEEFLVTSTVHTPVCPRCGKQVRTLGRRRLFRLLAFALLAALVAVIVAYLYLHK